MAFAIAAIALGVLGQIFGQGARNMSMSRDYDHALVLANSLLAEYGTRARLDETFVSDSTDPFHWVVALEPYAAPVRQQDLSSPIAGATAQRSRLVQIDVAVDWERNGKSRSINLSSLRLVDDNGNDSRL